MKSMIYTIGCAVLALLLSACRLSADERPLTSSTTTVVSRHTTTADTRAIEIHELWSHTRPNGESCFTALHDIGIHYRAAGENIAMGYRTPAAVVEGWMNSAGHRANILNEDFTHIVIGFHDYGWVQLFLSPIEE